MISRLLRALIFLPVASQRIHGEPAAFVEDISSRLAPYALDTTLHNESLTMLRRLGQIVLDSRLRLLNSLLKPP